jgi:hypothetical protein
MSAAIRVGILSIISAELVFAHSIFEAVDIGVPDGGSCGYLGAGFILTEL